MPSTPSSLLKSVGLAPEGAVRWGSPVPTVAPGVYLVSLHSSPEAAAGLPLAPLDRTVLGAWLERTPTLRIGTHRPATDELVAHLAGWWLPDEPVLYIGKATNLRDRVGQYYRTPLGARRPHAGGYWLKTLTVISTVTVHFATTATTKKAEDAEDALLAAFVTAANPPSGHPEPRLLLPWANLTLDRPAPRRRRHHQLRWTDGA